MKNQLSYAKPLIIIVIIFVSGSLYAVTKSPLPEVVKLDWPKLEMVGQTSLKRYGLHIYDASYWMLEGKASDFFSTNTHALSITYARKISSDRLLSSTKKEWIRLGFAEQYPIDAWLKILEHLWPDVTKGDQLIAVSSPDGKTTFYDNKEPIGTIEDANFGTVFFAIWLDENSRFKKNREELLGEE